MDKDLIINDLSSRIKYGVKGRIIRPMTKFEESYIGFDDLIDLQDDMAEITPYLRSMDKMTEKENEEYMMLEKKYRHEPLYQKYHIFDFLDSHMLDYRKLILTKDAIEAPDNMYNYE